MWVASFSFIKSIGSVVQVCKAISTGCLFEFVAIVSKAIKVTLAIASAKEIPIPQIPVERLALAKAYAKNNKLKKMPVAPDILQRSRENEVIFFALNISSIKTKTSSNFS